MKSPLFLVLVLGLFLSQASAQEKTQVTNSTQKISYALGMDVVRVLKLDDFDIDMKAISMGIADMQAGKPALTHEEQKAAMKEMQQHILAKRVAKKEAAGAVHKKEGQAFLDANAGRPGVQTMPVVAPDKSTAALQYKVLKSGPPGASPGMSDTVTVRYHGTLINGTVFDIFPDSVKHGDVAVFDMKDVIPGWAAALQVMKPGDRWELYVPPSLGYADYGPPEIGMYSTLIYQLELVSFSKTADNHSTTGDATPH